MRVSGDVPGKQSVETRIMRNFGYFGYYLHVHWGGRNGKQHILVELLAHDGRMTQRELQEASCITSASLSEVIAKLEAEGLLARERSVTLTEAGFERARRLVRTRAEFEERAFDFLSPAERARLAETLDRVAQRWQEIEAQEKCRRAEKARNEKGDER